MYSFRMLLRRCHAPAGGLSVWGEVQHIKRNSAKRRILLSEQSWPFLRVDHMHSGRLE